MILTQMIGSVGLDIVGIAPFGKQLLLWRQAVSLTANGPLTYQLVTLP